MNKKMFALLVVPVFLIASGALAYSAFSGVASTSIAAKAGDITANEYAELVSGYSSNTVIYVSGGYGSNTDTATLTSSSVISHGEPNLATVPTTDTGAQEFIYYLNVSNLAPGNWVKVHFTLENKGTVGLVFGVPSIGTVTFSNSGLNLSNVTGALDTKDVFTSGNPLSGVSGLSGKDNYTFATTDSSVSSGTGTVAQTGYAFAFGPTVSDFGVSLTNGGEADYSFYLGLSSGAGNGYQESSISIPIIVSITSDP